MIAVEINFDLRLLLDFTEAVISHGRDLPEYYADENNPEINGWIEVFLHSRLRPDGKYYCATALHNRVSQA